MRMVFYDRPIVCRKRETRSAFITWWEIDILRDDKHTEFKIPVERTSADQ